MSRHKLPPTISNISVTPASGPGGTIFAASVTASGHPPLRIEYQWLLDGMPIDGATGSSHIASDAGELSVRVTATNREGSDVRVSAVVLVTPALAVPVVTEASVRPLEGNVGDTFTAIAAATGVPVPAVSYQWLRDGLVIHGATAATYDATAEGAISVRVTASNSEGSDSVDSAPAIVGAALAPPAIEDVLIRPASGRVGDTFSATAQVTGSPQPDLAFQWLLDGVLLLGETGTTCTATSPGVLTVRVIATNTEGSATRESAPVPVDPALGLPPEVREVAVLPAFGRVGDTFSAEALVTGDPAPTLAYQWLIDGTEIAGATGETHAPLSTGQLAVRVTASNELGSASASSDGVVVEAALAPPVVTSADILPTSGGAGEPFTIVASVTGNPAPELTYQWRLDGEPVPGASGPTYVAEAPGMLDARVTASNAEGVDSIETAAVRVEPALEAPQVREVAISPAAGRVGDTFGAIATASGNPEPTLAYQWKLDGLAIDGATGSTFTPETEGALSLRVTASNSQGSATALSESIAIEPALAAPSVKSADILPNVGRVGDTFTVHAKVCGNPVPDVTYEWMLDGSVIEGVTGTSYMASQEGTLFVRVIARNSEGEDQRESGAVDIEPALAAPAISNVTILPAGGQIGDTFLVSATVDGNPRPSLSFQWSIDGAIVEGATDEEFVPTRAGALTVLVTASSTAGTDTLVSAAVTVTGEVSPAVFEPGVFEAGVFA